MTIKQLSVFLENKTGIRFATSSHNRNENQGKGKRGKFYG